MDNVKANTEGELNYILLQLLGDDGDAQFRSGDNEDWPQENVLSLRSVRNGSRTIVVPATPEALKKLVGFLTTHLQDIIIFLTIDEADALLTTGVTRALAESDQSLRLLQRGASLFELLGRVPLGEGSRCRSVLWVSAKQQQGVTVVHTPETCRLSVSAANR